MEDNLYYIILFVSLYKIYNFINKRFVTKT